MYELLVAASNVDICNKTQKFQCKTTVVGLIMQKLSTMATVLFNSWCPVTAFVWLIIVVCMWLCIMRGYFVLSDSLPCWLVVPHCWWFPFLISSCVGVYSNFLNCYSQCVLCIMLSIIYYNNRIYIAADIFYVTIEDFTLCLTQLMVSLSCVCSLDAKIIRCQCHYWWGYV